MNEPTAPRKESNWPRDYFGRAEIVAQFWWVMPLLLTLSTLLFLLMPFGRHNTTTQTVVIYASQDQVYAEPILRDFEKETGIKVRALFDGEAVKTVGLANRLLAENSRPQCDVFWNNEELRTRQLAARHVFRESNAWAAVGFRSRRLVINTNKLSLAIAPRSLLELTNVTWRGQIALAYPLFGTTATHFLALRQHWGEAGWLAWCQALVANKPFLVDGNSVVVKFVERGDAVIGLTDSDDIAAAQREGAPLAAVPLSAEALLIPNTIAVIRDGPHPLAGQRLAEFLQRTETLRQLIEASALEGISAVEANTPTLRPDWEKLLDDLDPATAEVKRIFLR